jgi:hypothetical protein
VASGSRGGVHSADTGWAVSSTPAGGSTTYTQPAVVRATAAPKRWGGPGTHTPTRSFSTRSSLTRMPWTCAADSATNAPPDPYTPIVIVNPDYLTRQQHIDALIAGTWELSLTCNGLKFTEHGIRRDRSRGEAPRLRGVLGARHRGLMERWHSCRYW